MEPNPLEITVGDGKYTVVQTTDGRVLARHREDQWQPWRNITGDKLVLCLAQELDAARAEIRALHRDELLKRIDVLEAESGDLRRKIDELEDELARAREGDL